MGTQRFNFGIDLAAAERLYLAGDHNSHSYKGIIRHRSRCSGRRRRNGYEVAKFRPCVPVLFALKPTADVFVQRFSEIR